MDQNGDTNINNSANKNPMMPNIGVKPESSLGPIIGIIVVVAILVLGGLYYWSKEMLSNKSDDEAMLEIEQMQQDTSADAQAVNDPTAQKLNSQSSSDDIGSISQDLKATNLNLNAELNDPNNSPQ